MSIVKWFKSLFSEKEKSNEMDVPEGFDSEDWCRQQIFLKMMETGKPCCGSWKDGKYVVEVCDE